MSARRRLGAVLVVVGLLVAGAGVIAAMGAGGGPATAAASPPVGPSPSDAAPNATPATTPTATPTLTAAPTPTPSPTPDPDTLAKAFFVDLVAAIRAGDVDSMLPRLHPAVIDRYGDASCKTELETRSADPTYAIVVKAVHPPAAWDYTLDGLTTSIPDAWTVEADVTALGKLEARELHVAPVDGQVRWFSDCGTPLP